MAKEGLTETVQDLIRGNCGIENSNRVSNFHKKNSYGWVRALMLEVSSTWCSG